MVCWPHMVTPRLFTLFDTPVGRCGIAWGERGVVGMQLPEGPRARHLGSRSSTISRRSRSGAAPRFSALSKDSRASVRGGERLSDCRARHGSGTAVSSPRLRGCARDLAGCYPLVRRPRRPARFARSARAVGQALGHNPFAIVVPCHRVLAAGGKLGGFSANGGIVTKLRLLSIEGATGEGASGVFRRRR